jgi:hypothetical protein
MNPLAVGTKVRVVIAPALDGEPEEHSEPTTIAAVQWYDFNTGEIYEDPNDIHPATRAYQYLLDAAEPMPDTAVLPEYVVQDGL